MKVKQVLGGLVNYLAAVGLALIFALFLSGRIGWFLVLAFLCAPVLSLLMTLLFRSRIYVTSGVGAAVLCKGDVCEVSVTVSSGCFLPSPPVCIEAAVSAGAVCGDKSITLSLMPFSEESFELKYTAKICGPASVGIKSVRITDYFGIFSFPLVNIDENELISEIGIIPDIADVKPVDPTVKQVMELSAAADDSEDTTENTLAVFGGFPGYDSRDYVPGDPLKRINWKQSAKRGRLLVRLDDETACSSVSVIIDSVFTRDKGAMSALTASQELSMYNDIEIFPMAAQCAVEYALGAARVFLRQSCSVTFFTMGENGWECTGISDEGDLSGLAGELAMYRFSEDNSISRFPETELAMQKGTVSLYCTPYLDRELYGILSGYTGSSAKGSLKTAVMTAAADREIAQAAQNALRGSEADVV